MRESEKRLFNNCLYLAVPLIDDEAELDELFKQADSAQSAITKMLNGTISIEDFLESVEPFVSDIDAYIDEVEENLEDLEKSVLLYARG